jgi:Flp pilus assembly protein TadG
VEFGLILPLLVTIVLGCVDFGRFAYRYMAVTNAARAGAGYGCVNPYTTATLSNWRASVKQAAIDEMSQISGYDSSKLTVTADPVTTGEPGGLWRVQVTVSYPFQTLVTWPGIPSNMTLSRTVVLRGDRGSFLCELPASSTEHPCS